MAETGFCRQLTNPGYNWFN